MSIEKFIKIITIILAIAISYGIVTSLCELVPFGTFIAFGLLGCLGYALWVAKTYWKNFAVVFILCIVSTHIKPLFYQAKADISAKIEDTKKQGLSKKMADIRARLEK